jgi:hypothetical protein
MSFRANRSFYLTPSGNTNDGVSSNAGQNLDGATVTISAAFVSAPIHVKDLDAYSIQFSTVAGDTLVGTLTLEYSNDQSGQELTETPGVLLKNWIPSTQFFDEGAAALATSKAVASGAQTFMFSVRNCTHRWVRLRFAFTSGSGKPTVTLQQKAWP